MFDTIDVVKWLTDIIIKVKKKICAEDPCEVVEGYEVCEEKDVETRSKYANNYDYNKAVYLMSEYQFLDNGFFLLKYHFCQEDKCQLYSENVQCQDALKWEYIISTKFLND